MVRGSRIACLGSGSLGTTPDDDPLMRSQSTRVRAQAVASTLLAKGIEVSPGFTPESVMGFTGIRRSNCDGRNGFLRSDSEALQRI